MYNYLLRLGDSSLILGHRNSEWCGHGPILEEDIALTNISLDLVGQATSLLEQAALVEGKGRTGDDLAFMRDAKDFRNCLLAEQANEDYGQTILRQFFYSTFSFVLYTKLQNCKDEFLAAFAVKSLKEVTYHVRHSKQWVLRLGDGTAESHSRMQKAMDNLWSYTQDLFSTLDSERNNDKLVAFDSIQQEWMDLVKSTLAEATLTIPTSTTQHSGSREGKHSEQLSVLLAEMQVLPRTYPGASW